MSLLGVYMKILKDKLICSRVQIVSSTLLLSVCARALRFQKWCLERIINVGLFIVRIDCGNSLGAFSSRKEACCKLYTLVDHCKT